MLKSKKWASNILLKSNILYTKIFGTVKFFLKSKNFFKSTVLQSKIYCIGMPIQDRIYSLDEVASYVIHRKLLDLDFLIPSSSDEMLKIELLSNMIHHSMATANLNKSEDFVTNNTAASKYIPRRPRISIN